MRRPDAKSPRANAPKYAETKLRELGGPKSSQKRPILAASRNFAVCEDWVVETVGLELETHYPVIEPVSA